MKKRYVRGLTSKPVLQKPVENKACITCAHCKLNQVMPAKTYICKKMDHPPMNTRGANRYCCRMWEAKEKYELTPDHIWL